MSINEIAMHQPMSYLRESASNADPALRAATGTLHGAAATYPAACLHELVAAVAAWQPGAVALRSPAGDTVTYSELEERAGAVASRLAGMNVRRGTCVAVALPRDPGLVVALLAILNAGAFYLPLDLRAPTNWLSYVLRDSGAAVVLTTAELRPRLLAALAGSGTGDGVPDLLTVGSLSGSVHFDPPAVTQDDLAYLIYTSGSTGRPKGVLVPHRGVVNLVTDAARLLGSRSVLFSTTPAFDIAALEIFMPLASGGTIVVLADDAVREPGAVGKASEGVDLVQLTPSVAKIVADDLRTGLPKMICGGEQLPVPLAHRILEGVGELWNFYGPTETTIWSCAYQVPHEVARMAIGTPLANTTVHVLDQDLQPVAPGMPGELFIGGVGVVRGYHGRPDLTAERFVPDTYSGTGGRLYRTGDRVRLRPDHVLEFIGRLDDQVKIRGHRIDLLEIETVLRTCPSVRSAVVQAREAFSGDMNLVAYLVAADEPAETQVVRDFLAARLPAYMLPTAWVWLDALPLLPSGKTDRQALPTPDEPDRSEYVPPRTPMEEGVAAAWEEVLNLDQVGVHDDFLDLGGQSILAIQLVGLLQEKFPVELSVRSVFDARTVERLAEEISRALTHLAADPPSSDVNLL
jgi:amino acid adenylation domain-containing protein